MCRPTMAAIRWKNQQHTAFVITTPDALHTWLASKKISFELADEATLLVHQSMESVL